MYVIKVCKTYSNSIKKRNNNTKKSRYKLYFYNEAGIFGSCRISKIKAFWIKLFVKKHKVKKCKSCGQNYLNSCPYCVYI